MTALGILCCSALFFCPCLLFSSASLINMYVYISTDRRCRGDHVYYECGTSCGLTCETYNLPPGQQPVCLEVCSETCACPPGLIPLSSDSAECVRPEECPVPECPPTQVYRQCGAFCGVTCLNQHFPSYLQPLCSPFCNKGCFCERGLIPADQSSSLCVRRDECSTANCTLPPVAGPCRYAHVTVLYCTVHLTRSVCTVL